MSDRRSDGETHPFVVSRVFEFPVQNLFELWTEPQHLVSWMGGEGSSAEFRLAEIRPGGTAHYWILGSDGRKIWGKIYYREIEAPHEIEYIQMFSDEAGQIAPHPLVPHWPQEIYTQVKFLSQGKKTTVTLEWRPLNASPQEQKTFDQARPGMAEGWKKSFDQLQAYAQKVLKK